MLLCFLALCSSSRRVLERMAVHLNYSEGCWCSDLSFLRQNFKITSTWALCAGEHRQEKGEGLMLPKNNPCFEQSLFIQLDLKDLRRWHHKFHLRVLFQLICAASNSLNVRFQALARVDVFFDSFWCIFTWTIPWIWKQFTMHFIPINLLHFPKCGSQFLSSFILLPQAKQETVSSILG